MVWGDRRGSGGGGEGVCVCVWGEVGGSALHSDEIKWRLKC